MSEVGSGVDGKPILTLGQEERDSLAALGDRLLGENRFAEARAVYHVLLATEKSNAFYYRAYGVCCDQTDRTDDAKAALDRAIALDPQDAHALTARAAIRLREGEKAAALRDLETAHATAEGKTGNLAGRIRTLTESAK